ncbi:unnamed protein product [Rhizopus stolonifer]
MKLALLLSLAFTMVASIPMPNTGNSLQEFYITEPINEITYIMGETATLTWVNGIAVDLDIIVLEGNDQSTMTPSALKSTIKSAVGPGTFTLPINSAFDESKTYCFQLVYTLDQQT